MAKLKRKEGEQFWVVRWFEQGWCERDFDTEAEAKAFAETRRRLVGVQVLPTTWRTPTFRGFF